MHWFSPFENVPIVTAGIGGLGPWELIIVLLIVMVVFGAGKLPAVGSSLGQALKNFKSAIKGDGETEDKKSGPTNDLEKKG